MMAVEKTLRLFFDLVLRGVCEEKTAPTQNVVLNLEGSIRLATALP